jgi:hypothetical protein
VGFWDPAAKTNKFGKEIANGRLTTWAVIGMYSACRRRLASGTRLRRPASFARDRKRPPGHDDGHRHVLCVQAPVGFRYPAAKTKEFCEDIAKGRLAMMAIIGTF